MKHIGIAGSLNMDLSIQTDRLPRRKLHPAGGRNAGADRLVSCELLWERSLLCVSDPPGAGEPGVDPRRPDPPLRKLL